MFETPVLLSVGDWISRCAQQRVLGSGNGCGLLFWRPEERIKKLSLHRKWACPVVDSWQFPLAVIWCHELGRNTELWERLGGLLPALICRGPRMFFKVFLQFFLNRCQNLFWFGVTPNVYILSLQSISSNNAHLGSLWRRLVHWAGHKAQLALAPHPFLAMTLQVSHLTSLIAALSAGYNSMDMVVWLED